MRHEGARRVLRQATVDAFEGAARVVRATRLPTRKGMLDFFSHQVLIHAVAWTAGLIAAGLVASRFEVRGLRNLWGLAASGSRTLVSAADYRWIMALAGFCAGRPRRANPVTEPVISGAGVRGLGRRVVATSLRRHDPDQVLVRRLHLKSGGRGLGV